MINECILSIAISIIIPLNTAEVNSDAKATKIEALEEQKDELLRKINAAIDETLQNLQGTKNTDGLLALNHMTELKKQIKQLNQTENNLEIPDEIFEGSLNSSSPKRDNLTIDRRYATLESDRNSAIKLNLKEIMDILKRNQKYVWEDIDVKKPKHREELDEKLRLWLLQRQKEKRKIDRYRVNMTYHDYVTEKCPKFGKGKKHKRSFRRTQPIANSDDVKKVVCVNRTKRKRPRVGAHLRKGRPVYPCCRKCCKKSGMGCL